MSDATPAKRALSLTDAIYAAAVSPSLWNDFLAAFSDDLGGAAIAMSLQLPGTMAEPEYYRAHLSEQFVPEFERHFRLGLPWPMTDPIFREGFGRGSAVFPDEQVSDTGYYRDYMQPQGMAAEGPIAHLIFAGEGRPISGISIQRLEGHREIDDGDLAMCNLLVPHLACAHGIRRQLRTSRREQWIREEILDRIPTGVVLLDSKMRTIAMNRSGKQILKQRDGLHLDGSRLCTANATRTQSFERLIDDAIGSDGSIHRLTTIERPSGRRPYWVLISAILDSPADDSKTGRAAAVFVTDPEANVAAFDAFQQMYGLTPAQTELVSQLADGRSLEQISKNRGVSIHTTRSQLKQVFTKTNTRRQPELVRLALTGISQVHKN